MSEGPITQWRKSHQSPRVSSSNATRVCFTTGVTVRRAYCGRVGKTTTQELEKVTCSDCRAALAADGDAP